jgi:hypothetical protein
MQTTTAAICQSCRKPIQVEYARLGAAVRCPHCTELTVPIIPVGGTIPPSGTQITFRDFCYLLEYPTYRNAVEPLIAKWFGFKIAQSGQDVFVLGKDGIPVDKLWLHLSIQSDAAHRENLYQTAMSLWR